jgi:multiple sugar transport system permease protein
MRLETLSPKTPNLPGATYSIPSAKRLHFPGQRLLENPRVFPVALLVPVLIFFIILNVVPTLWMVGLSFYKYSPISNDLPKFIGANNFIDIYKSTEVWRTLGRTFVFSTLAVSIETILGGLLGLLFWRSTQMPGRRLALTLLFTPMILTPVATGVFFRLIYDPTFGVVNYFVKLITGTNVDFLGDASWAFTAVLIVEVWMWTPFMILITLAALGSVPKAELEAAEIDRLPWTTRFVHVILPHAKFVLMLGILLRTIDSFKSMDLIWLMTRGGPGSTTEVIPITLFRKAFEALNLGWSSALALITLLIAIAFTSIYLYVLNLRKAGRAS